MLKIFPKWILITFTADVTTIFHHLFSTYSYITLDEQQEQKDIFWAQLFEIHQYLAILFENIGELEQVVTVANNLHTATKLANIGIAHIKNFNNFWEGFDVLCS